MPIIITADPYTVLGNKGLVNYRGEYATPLALMTAIPVAMNGDYAVVTSTGTIWKWEGTAWVDTLEIGFTQTERNQLSDLVNNAEVIAGHANTFALLPDVIISVGQKWIVDTTTGVWGINRKPAGTYLSTGTIWTSKFNAVDVINSLTSTQTQKALSAAQGKILNDRLVIQERVVFGQTTITSPNGIATPLTANVPAKLVLALGSDEPLKLENVTHPTENRLEINESVIVDVLITASISLDKSQGGTDEYRVHVYMDGLPLPVPAFIDGEISARDQVYAISATALAVSSGVHFFELWVENTNDNSDVTYETGQFSIEVIK